MVTVQEVAKHLQVTERTIYRWISDGCPFEKIGYKHYADSLETVKDWLKEVKK